MTESYRALFVDGKIKEDVLFLENKRNSGLVTIIILLNSGGKLVRREGLEKNLESFLLMRKLIIHSSYKLNKDGYKVFIARTEKASIRSAELLVSQFENLASHLIDRG